MPPPAAVATTAARRVARLALAAGFALAAAPGLAASAVYLHANGLTWAGLALCSAVGLGLATGLALLRPTARPLALGVALASLAVGGSFLVARLTRGAGPAKLAVCLDGACGQAPWWTRVPPEHEAARAGLSLSGLLGTMRGAEFDAFDRLLDVEYAKLEGPWGGLPNALLLSSGAGGVWAHRWVPPGGGPKPCLVFLHGFGGQLTPYLRAMVESELGRDFVIVAPALDPVGAWWSPRGTQVVERVLDQLPPEADPKRVYLVGLSNGGIGAARLATLPRLRERLRGAVLVSGIGDAGDAVRGARFLVLSGARDPRFRWPWVKELAARLEADGAEVTVQGYDADHFLLLTHAGAWTHRAHEWISADAAR